MARQPAAIACATLLAGVATWILFWLSDRWSLRSPKLALLEPHLGAEHLVWFATVGMLLFAAGLAGYSHRSRVSLRAVSVAAAILLASPLLLVAHDVLAVWVALSAALGGFYLTSSGVTACVRSRELTTLLPWLLGIIGFGLALLWTVWAILFLE